MSVGYVGKSGQGLGLQKHRFAEVLRVVGHPAAVAAEIGGVADEHFYPLVVVGPVHQTAKVKRAVAILPASAGFDFLFDHDALLRYLQQFPI
jgi:hypothetical protein